MPDEPAYDLGQNAIDTDALYEKWRLRHSRVDPSADFADRVMRSLDSQQMPRGSSHRQPGAQGVLRISLWAAAVLAALVRVVELFSLFSASHLEN
jgi:hypothetical protein